MIVLYGVYVFAGSATALGASILWGFYVSISFLSGDMKIRKGEIDVPNCEKAEEDQLNGLS